MGKTFLVEFLKKKDMEPRPKEAKAALPWVDPGVEASEDEEEDPGKEGLKAKLLKARDEVKKLERELTGKKVSTKAAGSKDKKEKVKKKKPTPEGKEKKKRKRAKESPSSGGEKKKKKKKKKASRADDEAAKEARMAKGKKKAIDESSSSSDDEDEGLFGECPEEKVTAGAKKGRCDRGPFGGGDLVRFQGESSSELEAVFREAPAVPKASNQLKLMQYAKRTPGRLASRLALEDAGRGSPRGCGGESSRSRRTDPASGRPLLPHDDRAAVGPASGDLRAHREMRTLCTALDMLARKLPAHAADLLGQRLKAIEKSCHDGHWQAAVPWSSWGRTRAASWRETRRCS